MLKLIGATLVLASTTLTGFHFANLLAERTKQLRALLMSLQMLETEIYYGSTPLEVAFQKLSQQEHKLIAKLFNNCSEYLQTLDGVTTYECWKKALDEMKGSLALKKTEIEWLYHFGQVIGSSDRDDQKKHIKLLMSHLQKQEQEAQEDQNRYEKMYKTLGVLGGLVIVILMM